MKSSAAETRVSDSLAYLDDYLDTVESLPLELQRQFTLMQDLDAKAQSIMSKVGSQAADFVDKAKDCTAEERVRMLQSLSELLVESLRQGEDKVALATAAYDVVDRHVRRLDDDLQKYEDEQMIGPGRIPGNATVTGNAATAEKKEEAAVPTTTGGSTNKKAVAAAAAAAAAAATQEAPPNKKRKQNHGTGGGHAQANAASTTGGEKGKKGNNIGTGTGGGGGGKVKAKATTYTDMPIDPNEPLYCYCQQVSYGEMVACDNADCEIEWFHLSCADLKAPPKGKWYCKDCSQKSKKPVKK